MCTRGPFLTQLRLQELAVRFRYSLLDPFFPIVVIRLRISERAKKMSTRLFPELSHRIFATRNCIIFCFNAFDMLDLQIIPCTNSEAPRNHEEHYDVDSWIVVPQNREESLSVVVALSFA